MKYKLFIKEYIGSVKKMILFSSIVVIFLTAVGLMWINMLVNSTSNSEADVIICGQRDEYSYGFKLYDSIPDIILAAQVMDKDYIDVVPSVTRNIISIQNGNSLQNVMCTVKGYDEHFIKKQFVFTKGREPKPEKKEVALGSNIAQMLNISVGDTIGESEVEIAGIDGVGIALTLESDLEDFQFENYTVVGIIDENLKDLSYSFLIPYSESDSSIIPNTLELYFKNDAAINEYKDFIEVCSKNQISIPNVSERFETKKNIKNQTMMSMFVIVIFSIFIIYLLIAYLCKGIGRKLGLLKSFGIKNSTIVKMFAGGLSVLVGVSYVISVVFVNVICYFQNMQLSELLGYSVNRYAYTLRVYTVQFVLSCVFVLWVWGIIYWKIKTTSPKLCMSK